MDHGEEPLMNRFFAGLLTTWIIPCFVVFSACGSGTIELPDSGLGTIGLPDGGPGAIAFPDGADEAELQPSPCGNGVCEDGENCQNCADDCGDCPSAGFQFFVFGDTRSYPSRLQTNINSMAQLNLEVIAAFNTGDITANGTRSEWDDHHEALAAGASDPDVPADANGIARQSLFRTDLDNFDAGVRYFGVVGNHDVHDGDWFDNWNLYLPGQQGLGKNSKSGIYFSVLYDRTFFIVLDSEHPSSTQTSWLEQKLQSDEAQSATWVFVFFHHPVYPCNDKSPFDEGLPWVRLFEQYGVDIAFVAHSHTYERSCPMSRGQCADGGVIYLNSSGGGADVRSVKPTKSDTVSHDGDSDSYDCAQILEYGSTNHHFCHVSVSSGHAVVDCYDSDNVASPFDSLSLAK